MCNAFAIHEADKLQGCSVRTNGTSLLQESERHVADVAGMDHAFLKTVHCALLGVRVAESRSEFAEEHFEYRFDRFTIGAVN